MDIPRSENPSVIFGMLPVLAVLLSTAKGDSFIFVASIVAGLTVIVVAVLLNYRLYIRKTPLARIDQTSFVFFGDSRSQQRSFQHHSISAISLSRRPLFWRSPYRLSLSENGRTVNLWIQHQAGNNVSRLAQALKAEFPGRLVEVTP